MIHAVVSCLTYSYIRIHIRQCSRRSCAEAERLMSNPCGYESLQYYSLPYHDASSQQTGTDAAKQTAGRCRIARNADMLCFESRFFMV